MRVLTTFMAVTALTVSGFSASAGGLSDEIMEAPVVAAEPAPAAPTSSISPTFIVLGVLAALLIASSIDNDDEEEDEAPTPGPVVLTTG